MWTRTFVHLIYGHTYKHISELTIMLHDYLYREKDNIVTVHTSHHENVCRIELWLLTF